MPLMILVKPEAEADLAVAKKWYDTQSPSLGNQFLDEITTAFQQIQQWPALSPIVFRKVRMKLLSRFPYVVLYRVDETQVTIIAIYHTGRSSEASHKNQ